jgi:hypothetical protein
VSKGLVQIVRILLSTHSHRQAACAVLASGNAMMQMARNTGATRIFNWGAPSSPDPFANHSFGIVLRLRLLW